MTPTMTRELMLSLMDHIRQGMVAYLIYYPELGMGALSPIEYQRRYNLTMREAVSYELGLNHGLTVSGYSRFVPVGEDLQVYDTHLILTVRCRWTAISHPIGPFTHVVLARGCNLYGGTAANGMNRGDYVGQVILCQPQAKDALGLTIQPGATYECSIPVRMGGRTY